MDQLMRGLMADTLSMAGVIGEIRPGECGKAVAVKGEGTAYRCTVFYEGFEAVWKAQFTDVDSGGGWTTAQYRAWPVTGVLTAKAVYAAHGWNTDKGQQPRCDKMPRVFRAEAGKATAYKCQILLSQCSNGTWHFRWSDRSVWINDEGRVDFRS
ncbi:hypothetical protein ACFUTV_39995 [Streptomyces sp. NPDC057298]|uniref:hypothetical protein n=1 Tax=Streptomyces sp. NPDC057298 TaxID=3346091 RepID=UPI003639C27A